MENAGGCALVNWQVHLALFYGLRESHRSINVAEACWRRWYSASRLLLYVRKMHGS